MKKMGHKINSPHFVCKWIMYSILRKTNHKNIFHQSYRLFKTKFPPCVFLASVSLMSFSGQMVAQKGVFCTKGILTLEDSHFIC